MACFNVAGGCIVDMQREKGCCYAAIEALNQSPVAIDTPAALVVPSVCARLQQIYLIDSIRVRRI
jgi:hypothetical protein